MTHPLDTLYGPGDIDKAAVSAFGKLRRRYEADDPDDVRTTDLTGQFGGIYVRSLDAAFELDTEDVQADDGENVLIDAAGNHFVKSDITVAPISQTYDDSDVSSGVITIGEQIDIAYIDTTTSVIVNIPTSSTRNGRTLTIKDIGGNGFTPTPDGSETFDGIAPGSPSGFEVTTPYGFVVLGPVTDGYAIIGSQF